MGCTSFKKLLQPHRIQLRKIFTPSSPNERKLKLDQIYSKIFHNKTWHKALFYREPLERFLSGYLDKCVKEPARVYCIRVFGSNQTTFDEAVRHLLHQDPNKFDAHFHHQIDHCGGLSNNLQYFDTVELLDPASSREMVGKMLQKANMTSIHYDKLYPSQRSAGAIGHRTNANKIMEEYYANIKHVGIVTNFFYEDYTILNIPLPSFAVQALLELNRTMDEFRLPLNRLERLLDITSAQRQEESAFKKIGGTAAGTADDATSYFSYSQKYYSDEKSVYIYILTITLIIFLLFLWKRRIDFRKRFKRI